MASKLVFSMFDLDGFIRDAGAQRVDENASRKLGQLLEDNGRTVVLKARQLARHAGRNKVTRDDIVLAARLCKIAR